MVCVKCVQYSHRTLNDLEQVSQEAEDDFYEHYSNPLNAYKIIRRFVIDWQNLNKTVFAEQPARGETMLYQTQNLEISCVFLENRIYC